MGTTQVFHRRKYKWMINIQRDSQPHWQPRRYKSIPQLTDTRKLKLQRVDEEALWNTAGGRGSWHCLVKLNIHIPYLWTSSSSPGHIREKIAHAHKKMCSSILWYEWILLHFFFSTLCDLMDCSLPSSSVHGDSPGKNTGVGCHAILQGIVPTQG